MQIIDPLLLEVGEKYTFVPVVEDEYEASGILCKQDY